jgi:hypothetical protein
VGPESDGTRLLLLSLLLVVGIAIAVADVTGRSELWLESVPGWILGLAVTVLGIGGLVVLRRLGPPGEAAIWPLTLFGPESQRKVLRLMGVCITAFGILYLVAALIVAVFG